ncbi:hypothetical protein [Limnobaculum parvum]|uniref:SH3 domain-containing protein n=1 Tax=Limnobaculum parvum TaxID=2172103 RepID=A0A2Y9U0Z4_9GAMM|nr:hypothetical protein [Limnobaculum parvum]AWH89625.1 hypothetical protein HYN51_14345 [Limnobaculum parvum]
MIKFISLFLMIFLSFISDLQAEDKSCSIDFCGGIALPKSIKDLINGGYNNIEVVNLLNKRYLTITSNNEINKCSILFSINENSIDDTSVFPKGNQICNYKIINNNFVSHWRDGGKWYEDIYQMKDSKGELIFRDECIGCDLIKRTVYSKNKIKSTALLTGDDNFTERKTISGVISVNKAILLKSANSNDKLRAYLIKGDVFDLIDMSDDGGFYKIKYLMKNNKILVAWISVDEFSISR